MAKPLVSDVMICRECGEVFVCDNEMICPRCESLACVDLSALSDESRKKLARTAYVLQ